MSFDIVSRYTKTVLYHAAEATNVTEAFWEARKRGADLGGADLGSANLSGAYLRGADLSGANLGGANLRGGLPIGWEEFAIPGLSKQVADAVISGEGSLEMGEWHTCDTTHCLAGWAVVKAGPAGKALEAMTSTSIAGAMLMPEAAHLFYATNEEAMAWLKEQAAK